MYTGPNITCDFSRDFCHWEAQTNDPEGHFIWRRRNGREISQDGISGPPKDRWESDESFFLHVSTNRAHTEERVNTAMISPYLIGSEHPVECLTFWFSRTVSHY
jgi:hypothetical protein